MILINCVGKNSSQLYISKHIALVILHTKVVKNLVVKNSNKPNLLTKKYILLLIYTTAVSTLKVCTKYTGEGAREPYESGHGKRR